MKPVKYQCKSGRYAGMWHVRLRGPSGKYFHVKRFYSEEEADRVIRRFLEKAPEKAKTPV